MSSRLWDYVGIGGIVIGLGFLFAAAPLLGFGVGGILLSLALAFVVAVAIVLFGRAVTGTFLLLTRPRAARELKYSEFVFSGSKRIAFLQGVILALLAFIGLVVLLIILAPQPRLGKSPAVLTAIAVKTSPQPQTPEELYLDLLKKTLTRAQVAGRYERFSVESSPTNFLALRIATPLLHDRGYDLVGVRASDPEAYMKASDANSGRLEDAETMTGLRQLDNVQFCVTDVLRRKVPGDLIEAGAWRGGITVLMRGILKAYGVTDRKVWVADSFEGLPHPDLIEDEIVYHQGQMAVSVDEVKENFARYGLLDDQVQFLKGYFNTTLPGAPIQKLAVFRADADLYQSTMDALNNLYSKLSVGGYAIFDDYNQKPVRKAIDEYRVSHGINEPIRQIDGQAVYWQRER